MSIHEFAEPFFRRVTNNNKEAGGSILVVTGTFSDMRQVNLYSLQTYFSHYGLSIFFLYILRLLTSFYPSGFQIQNAPGGEIKMWARCQIFPVSFKIHSSSTLPLLPVGCRD